MKTKILIVEPSQVIVEGLTAILKGASRFTVLTPSHTLEDFDATITALKPDIVIVNPTLCNDVAARCQSAGVKSAALVYQYVEPSRLRGMDITIDIRESGGSIIEHLIELSERQDDQASHKKLASYDLTKREIAVLIEVAKGRTNKEIADSMNISVYTVISHRKNIMQKTGIKSVAGLTVYAMLNNLIED